MSDITPAQHRTHTLPTAIARPARLLAVMLTVLLIASACADDTDLDQQGPVGGGGDEDAQSVDDADDAGSDTDADADATDTGDADDSLCADVSCGPDEICVEGSCVSNTCTSDEDLGTVFAGNTPVSVTIPAGEAAENPPQATCSTSSTPPAVIEFTAGEAAHVEIEVSSEDVADWVLDVRKDGCAESEETALFCTDREQHQFFVEEGATYYLLVQSRQVDERPDVTVDMTWTPAACSPPGDTRCLDDSENLEICYATGWTEIRCADTCTDDACDGDVCDSAIPVTQSGLYEGDNEAYDSAFDFTDRTECSTSGEAGIETPGPDVIFALPDLTRGQVVTIDTSEERGDFNDNALFILDDCSQQAACLAATDLGEDLTWEVPEDGTYYLVVDKTSWRGVAFAYHIDIQ